MDDFLGQSWWVLVLRGVFALAFGMLALMWPDLTLLLLVSMYVAYTLLVGGVSVVGAVKARHIDPKWWQLLLLGIVSIAAGVVALLFPALTALALVLLMGANALITGALDVAIAIRLRKVLKGHWVLALAGIASMVFGVLVFLFPDAGALALVWLISLYAVVTGVLLLSIGIGIRRAIKALEGRTTEHGPTAVGSH